MISTVLGGILAIVVWICVGAWKHRHSAIVYRPDDNLDYWDKEYDR